jgi:membrane peptidoglycan carboxypeptidase
MADVVSAVTRNPGLAARALMLILAGGLGVGLLASLLLPFAPALGGVLKVNTSIPVQLRSLTVPSKIYNANGQLMAVLQDSDFRRPVTLAQVAPIAVTAILDVEDRGFYTQGALDYSSILRAAKSDLFGGGGLQGGSTITQQLVKQSVLTSKRTFGRKIKEAILAIQLNKQMSKEAILDRYLNTIYLGNGAYGVGAAAYTYFDENASQLNLAQSALLAAMIENPAGYDPITHPEAALQRRDLAISQMLADNSITSAQAGVAESQTLPASIHTVPIAGGPPGQATFLEEVVNALENDPRYSALGATPEARYDAIFGGGLSIYTTLDPTMQAQAVAAVNQGLPNTGGTFTAALVAVDPTNGEVRALVPGNNSSAAGFDVITGLGGSGGRQPGSSFKLFTLLDAITQGYSIDDTIDGSSPCYFSDPGSTGKIPGVYQANNAEGFTGTDILSLTTATVDSINCAYLRLGLDLGLPSVVNQAAIMGVTVPNPTYPSLIIGGEGVEPIAMAGAYATVADNGVYHEPTFIDHVDGPDAKVLIAPPGQGQQVVSPADAAVADSVLTQVIARGTGTAAQLAGRPAAGKTGTTDNYTNGWFDGYTPQLATVVWMGDPNGNASMQPPATPEDVFGGTYPTQIWHDFMATALAGQPVLQFPSVPAGAVGPGKYLGPPSIDVSGQYGQAVPTNVAPPAPPPSTPATTCTGTTPVSSGSTGAGGPPASAATPATTCTTTPTSSPTSVTTFPGFQTTTTYPGEILGTTTTYAGQPPFSTTSPLPSSVTTSTFPNPPGVTCSSTPSGIFCHDTSTTATTAGGAG